MNELLCPAGSKDAFYEAIKNGADAIYLGLDKYSARAYASNFNIESLKELVIFAHLRNVKIYVTINTVIYDHELNDVFNTIDELANIYVDAIIVQDLAIFSYITSKYKSLKAHISTQVGIDDIYGARICKNLGATRIVFARETSLNKIKEIKDNLNIEAEAFIHGALCVGYSGNCFLSSSIGERSGNRGRCAGCCRKEYSLVDSSNNVYKTGYLLSMKDLNTSEYINNMKFIDSFKIEGRMKEPFYVGTVTNLYRSLIDNSKVNKDNFNKIFNRTYTKGFINNETSLNITNIEKPNNYGYEIGTIERIAKNKIFIRLNKTLNKGDQIRIDNKNVKEEISIPVLNLYDSSFNKVNSMNKLGIVECDKNVNIGDIVYKTKDINFINEYNLNNKNKIDFKKFPLKIEFNAFIGKPIFIKACYLNYKVVVKSEYLVESSINNPTTKENIINQLSKLNDSVYYLDNISLNCDSDIFISLKLLNELRREIVDKLNNIRLNKQVIYNDKTTIIKPKEYKFTNPSISVEVSNIDQYNLVKSLGIKEIYFNNIIHRNNANYVDVNDNKVLVEGLNGIEYYKSKNVSIISDYSLNITNHISAGILSNLGVDKITLSYEINKDNINELISKYKDTYQTDPNLELIVYGKAKVMHSKYCVLKRLGMCGQCKNKQFYLKDEYAYFPLKFNEDCSMTIYNSKTLNLLDDLKDLNNISSYRLVFLDESNEEIINIINLLKDRLNNDYSVKSFDPNIHTRGHYIKNPL